MQFIGTGLPLLWTQSLSSKLWLHQMCQVGGAVELGVGTSGTQGTQIALKKLIPVVIVAAIWGHEWPGHYVTSACDNQAVVAVLNSRYCREKDMMQLLRCLFFLETNFQFHLSAAYLSGVANDLAHDLSWDRLVAFLTKMPEAPRGLSYIPPSFLQRLLHLSFDWTSTAWAQEFSSFVARAQQTPPTKPTSLP